MTRPTAAPLLALALALAACRGGGEAVKSADSRPPEPSASAQSAPGMEAAPAGTQALPPCDADNGGITLPAGFCALVVADSVGAARHLAVAPNGDLYVALSGSRRTGARGGVLALRDTSGDGRADLRETFGSELGGGTGIAVQGGWLYHAPDTGVVRWRLPQGPLTPAGQPQTIVRGLPTGGHGAKTIALDGRGNLFVNVGSRTNACQEADRQPGSRGIDPCTELHTRAGIWRFDADRPDQTQMREVVAEVNRAGGERWAIGIRNAVALAVGPDGALYVAQHGRDQLSQNWPALFNDRQNAENPAEELLRVERGDDFGWPYCFYSVEVNRKVLAPEYGGNGREVGRCAGIEAPLVAFPGHWAPEAIAFYTGTQFPEQYRGGAFVSFHGSWNRAPLPQAGFQVAFAPFRGGRAAGTYETFADGFAGPDPSARARHRPMGVAVGPDGSLYVSDDAGGRIWRIVYRGR